MVACEGGDEEEEEWQRASREGTSEHTRLLRDRKHTLSLHREKCSRRRGLCRKGGAVGSRKPNTSEMRRL
jgi:hypothetical protein